MSRDRMGRNEPCFCGSGKKYKKCCYPRTLPDFSMPNCGVPYPHEEHAALRRALARMDGMPQGEQTSIEKVDVGRTRLTCAPLDPYGGTLALPGTKAPPTPLQIENKYLEIKAGNPEGAAEVIVTYTYPEPSGFAEARIVFDADEYFRLTDGRTVRILDLFRGMQVVLANGTIGSIIGNPERRYEIPPPPLPCENGLWVSRVVGRVKHTASEIVEFRWGGQMVRVTPSHVVWSADRKGWVGSRELRPGELIRVAGTSVAPVEGSRLLPGRVEVYGIEVEYFHNYFVGGGRNPMLVHNGPECVVKPRTYEAPDEGGGGGTGAEGGTSEPSNPEAGQQTDATPDTNAPGKPLTSAEDVAAYLKEHGKLPDNFITKGEAKALSWDPKAGNLDQVAPGKSIGGDVFYNKEGSLPSAPGRVWREADINYQGGYRGGERLLYSNDGLFYQTSDHYATFTQLQ